MSVLVIVIWICRRDRNQFHRIQSQQVDGPSLFSLLIDQESKSKAMVQDQRLVLPIAPANHGGVLEKNIGPLVPAKPAPPVEPAPVANRQKPPGLTLSRQWVLPPRPKPGRKPKPKPAKPSKTPVSTAATSPGQHHGKSSPNPQPKSSNGTRREIPTAAAAATTVTHKHEDDDCGLCSREDCMCETIGIKTSSPSVSSSASSSPAPEPRKSLPTLDMILNGPTIRMDAVPLKRPSSDRNSAAPNWSKSSFDGIKFRRSDDLQPMQPRHVLSVPSPLDGLQGVADTCGFCTENTPCACAEAAAASANNSASTPPSSAVQSPPVSGASANAGSTSAAASPQTRSQPMSPQSSMSASSFLATSVPSIMATPSAEAACASCGRDAMSMLFCLSLAASKPLAMGSVSIPCHLAFKTLQKHPRFEGCDLGKLVRRLEVSASRQVGVQSINRALQDLEKGEFTSF